MVDLSAVIDGRVTVYNKQSRVASMSGLWSYQRSSGQGQHDCACSCQLQGKLTFMDGQHCARSGVSSTRILGRRALGSNVPLRSELRALLWWSLDLLGRDLGKDIPLRSQESQIVIFTDGVVEGDESEVCSMGGVAFFPHKRPEHFSSRVPGVLVDSWKAEGRRHVIFHTELLPVMVAMLLCSSLTMRLQGAP
eukprot:4697892-Amphidinium_carterae.1